MEFFIIIIGIILDRITKLWGINLLKKADGISVIKGYFDFVYLENKGAAWGIMKDRTTLLSIITIIVLAAIIYYRIKTGTKSKLFRISFSLIVAGAVGNLFDRIYYRYVVDFISFHYKNVYYFPVFNVADMMVVCGTFLLALWVLKDGRL